MSISQKKKSTSNNHKRIQKEMKKRAYPKDNSASCRNTSRPASPTGRSVKSGINPLFTNKTIDNILKVCYNKYNETKERN